MRGRRGPKTCFWCNSRRVLGFKSVFGAIPGGFWAPNRFLMQSSAGFGLQIGFWCNPRRVWGFKSIFGAILGGFGASNRFLVQFPAGFGLQIDFWCNSRRVSRRPCRGVPCIRPTDVPTGTGTRTYLFGPTGPSNGANAIRPYTGTRPNFPASAEAAPTRLNGPPGPNT